MNAYPRRNAWGTKGENGEDSRKTRKKGKKTGKISLPEKGKMDTGKQQKGGRFKENGEIWTEGEDGQHHTKETRND